MMYEISIKEQNLWKSTAIWVSTVEHSVILFSSAANYENHLDPTPSFLTLPSYKIYSVRNTTKSHKNNKCVRTLMIGKFISTRSNSCCFHCSRKIISFILSLCFEGPVLLFLSLISHFRDNFPPFPACARPSPHSTPKILCRPPHSPPPPHQCNVAWKQFQDSIAYCNTGGGGSIILLPDAFISACMCVGGVLSPI